MARIRPRDIVLAMPELASPPEVYQRLTELLSRPDWTVARIAELLRAEPAIAARTLRLANSPVYGMPREIATVEDAVTVVGLAELRNLVLVTTVIENFTGIPTDVMSVRRFWERALRCAVASSLLAALHPVLDQRRLFLCGLLHDIGSLVCCLVLPEQSREALLHAPRIEPGALPPSVERTLTGDACATVSAALLDLWRLHGAVITTILWHPHPAAAPAEQVAAATVCLGLQLAVASEQGETDAFAAVSSDDPLWTLAAVHSLDPAVLMHDLDGGTREIHSAFYRGGR